MEKIIIWEDAEKTCRRCKEDWPNDTEFYSGPNHLYCRACKVEVRDSFPSRSKDARLAESERKRSRRSSSVG